MLKSAGIVKFIEVLPTTHELTIFQPYLTPCRMRLIFHGPIRKGMHVTTHRQRKITLDSH